MCTYVYTVISYRSLVNSIAFFKNEIIKDIKEIWLETIPKIFDVTKNESNTKLKPLYEESITCTSEGMVRYYNYIVVTWPMVHGIVQNVNLCLQA